MKIRKRLNDCENTQQTNKPKPKKTTKNKKRITFFVVYHRLSYPSSCYNGHKFRMETEDVSCIRNAERIEETWSKRSGYFIFLLTKKYSNK